MSNHLDPDRSIARWLVAEAPDHAPERLLEASRAQVRSTAQRRSLRLVRRIQAMNAYAKLAIAAAAVLVVAVVGINLGPGLNTISSEASPTSSPPASPTASPSVAPSRAVAPQPPVEFTGTFACGPPVRQPTTETFGGGRGWDGAHQEPRWGVAADGDNERSASRGRDLPHLRGRHVPGCGSRCGRSHGDRVHLADHERRGHLGDPGQRGHVR